MRGFSRAITMTTAVLAAMWFAPASDAGTVEQRLDELTQMVIQLQEVVQQQNHRIEQQQQVIRDMQRQIGSPQDIARRFEPHLDKHLLHEKSGLGEQLGNIRVGLGLTGVVQGSIDAEDASGERDDQTDASWSIDLELEAPVGERGLAYLLIEAGQGDGLTDELEALFHGVNDDAGDSESGLEVTEAWYEHYFRDERVVLAVGKLDMTNYFDTNVVANNETTQFLNSGLVNSIAVEFPEDNGAGVRLSLYPFDWMEFDFGWAEGDADWEDIANDSFGIAQINLKPNFAGKEGNYRFYVWMNGSDKEELDGGDPDEDGWGVGVSFDQKIKDFLTAFFRLGFADDDVYEVESTWAAGLEMRGTKWNREHDMFGVAVSQALLNDELDDDDTETLLEAYYRIALNEQIAISPDVQVIHNPGGVGNNDTVVVIGTRAQVNF